MYPEPITYPLALCCYFGTEEGEKGVISQFRSCRGFLHMTKLTASCGRTIMITSNDDQSQHKPHHDTEQPRGAPRSRGLIHGFLAPRLPPRFRAMSRLVPVN